MSADAEHLSSIAEAVADGDAVDWEGEARDHPELSHQLRGLHVMNSISEFHQAALERQSEGIADEVSLKIGETISHFKILKNLGAGGMGEVYLAEDTHLHRKVALKVLPSKLAISQERLERFMREAEALAALNHPNIVHAYSVEEAEGLHFFTMEFVEGESLRRSIHDGGLPLDRFFDLAIPMAEALTEAHERGIVHRDLKPANVMVDRKKHPKILDFGLAKLQQPESSEDLSQLSTAEMTQEGRILGTYPYMSPEQVAGKSVDHRSDIFSFGVMLYEMATGHRPFRGDSAASIISAILREEPPPVDEERRDLPHHLSQIVRRCLEKAPDDRYQHAKDLRIDLERLRKELVEHDRVSARRQIWILALVLLVVLLGVTAWVNLGRNTFPPGPGPAATSPEVGRLLDQAFLYEQRGDLRDTLETAESHYRKALELADDNPLIQAKLAMLLARIQRQYPEPGRFEEARALSDRALETDPELAPAWVARGILFLLEGNAEAAELAGREAQAAAPEDFNGYVLLGEALIEQGEMEVGLTEIRRGVEVGAGHVWARLSLGLELRALARYEDAAREFRKVLEYVPDSPNALNNLGLVLLDAGRSADALPYFRRVMDLYPDDRAATNLGYAYFKQNRLDEAVAAFHQAHELAPQRPIHARNLADTYEMQGDLATARAWFETALELYDRALAAGGPQGMLIGLRAVCAAKLDRHLEATANLERALELSPQTAYLLFVGSQIHALSGDAERMYRFAERALEAGISRDEFRTDLSFERYRDQPRFQSLIEG